MREALFWEKLEGDKVHCQLCRFHCRIADGHLGRCGVRVNRRGVLFSLVYGRLIAENVDPIEKKPLFHYLPGSLSYSIATVGCNFRCRHCQNADISQWSHSDREIPGRFASPEQVVRQARQSGCRSISYTYTEPTIFYEYALDTATLARREGLGNVFVTNGYITTEALERIAPVLDAANVDLKGFSESFYRDVTGASLQGVLDTLKEYRRLGIWLEITTLLIPGLNDGDAELKQLARFIREELGEQVPWHVTAFYPTYKMTDRPPTPLATLRRARRIGLDAGLRHVYTGNIPGDDGENTWCPECGQLLLERRGFRLGKMALIDGHCGSCQAKVAGIWQ
ncbi:MAG: AmmeMemoRadiSam system radical SAM enzyme [Desulfuromonadaceae bacterium GWC2_58_13]|nr:MAG: AmmeMemoRadiSam system radical SAM enzyme [Desulfuromonadaceae bacterium GWC2_58_13]